MNQAITTDLDRVLGFTLPARHARGRVARLGPALDRILDAHAYPPAIEKLLAEALVLAALLGSTLKDGEGQMTLQAQARGRPGASSAALAAALEAMLADASARAPSSATTRALLLRAR